MPQNLVNKARGEVILEHGGREYPLRLDFDALEKLSSALTRSVFEVAVAISNGGNIPPSEVMAILRAGLHGGGTPISEADCKALVMGVGLLRAFRAAADLLLVALAPAKAQDHFLEDAGANAGQETTPGKA